MSIRTEQIYEALFDDDAFARLPDVLARSAHARSAFMIWRHNDGLTQCVARSTSPPTWFDDYAEFAEHDPYLALALRPQNTNRVLLCNDWIAPATFEKSAIYNDLVRRHGDDTVYCMGSCTSSAWGSGIIGIHRGRNNRPFDVTDQKRLHTVIFHAERVLRARGELHSTRHAEVLAQGALDTLGLAIVVVCADMRVLHSNEMAENVFRNSDRLIVQNRRLTATEYEAEKKLSCAIAQATLKRNPTATAVAISKSSGEPAFLLTVTPLVARMGKPAAMILFRDDARPDRSLPARLRMLFDLSSAEAQVAADLTNGLSPGEIAANRGVSMNTLRTQMKSIHAKTECRRQSEFVALVRRVMPLG
jgi:DNA-binding CsgD family transcriptional regulator/PAS domain-containing protein